MIVAVSKNGIISDLELIHKDVADRTNGIKKPGYSKRKVWSLIALVFRGAPFSSVLCRVIKVFMESSATSQPRQLSQDNQIWDSLKQAIAASSGFQRWQIERSVSEELKEYSLDSRVRRYLRETLENLAC